MKRILTALILCYAHFVFAQTGDTYSSLIKQAQEYYKNKDYAQSAVLYTKAFIAFGGKGYVGDRYNAARAWANAGNADSAFDQLQRITIKTGFQGYDKLIADTNLFVLHTDERWSKLCEQVKANKEKAEAHLNRPLAAELDSIYEDDQQGRKELDTVEAKYGRDSKEVKELWQKINRQDSIDLVKVENILNTYGWPGVDEVKMRGNSAVFLVIQHAPLKVQEQYLPIMREAVKKQKAQPGQLALLEDRVALGEGKKQIYGSQIGVSPDGSFYISPLEDPDNVDKRRAEVGLGHLSDYVADWNIKWDPEQYKKDLPRIEQMQKGMMQKAKQKK